MSTGPRDAPAVAAAVAATGLLERGTAVLVLLSGGRDSVCLLDLAASLCGAGAVSALHVDHGLRAGSHADEQLCRELCERLGIPLAVERPAPHAAGNLQAWARAVRYAAAERHRPADGRVAAGHTADDQVETLLYRLAAAPGRRGLLGMRAADGDLVRPLLGVTREETAAYCAERGLPWVEDPSNADPAYARNRVRHGLLPAWRSLHPAADANALATQAALRDEAEVLDALVSDALASAGLPPRVDALAAMPAALARLAVQALADRAAGGAAPAVGGRAAEILALGRRGGTASLDLPGGLVAEVSYGRLELRARVPPPPPPRPGRLPVPGELAFGGGVLRARRGTFPAGEGVLRADALDAELEVRAWHDGDAMRPAGLGGTKSLQDLFTDRKVPRGRRRRLPVVLSGGEVAWIPGVATGEPFATPAGVAGHVRLSWHEAQYDGALDGPGPRDR